MKKINYRKRNYIIIGLCLVLALMAVGFAAFSQSLQINGTSSITSNWCIGFDKTITNNIISKVGVTGASMPRGSIEYSQEQCGAKSQMTANISATLNQPGDTLEYTLTIINEGSLDAKIDSIIVDGNSVTRDTVIQKGNVIFNIGRPEESSISAGQSTTMKVTVAFQNSSDITNTYDGEEQSITAKINASQDGGTGGMNFTDNLEFAGQTVHLAATGDGLYEDSAESGRYIYRGENPNNYMTFNGEEAGWRIVAIESDGTIKIVKNSDLAAMPYDARNSRTTASNTYCINAARNGCNAWAATENLVGTPSEFTLYYPNGNMTTDNITYTGTVTKDASINTFLNGEYYNNPNSNASYLGEDKNYIVNHNFYIGTPGDFTDTESITINSQQEKNYVWRGKVGLIQATDYLKASTNNTCIIINNATLGTRCQKKNYLSPDNYYYWTISPAVESDTSYVYSVGSSGIGRTRAWNTDYWGVRPTMYLPSSINLKGEGTATSPYYIE